MRLVDIHEIAASKGITLTQDEAKDIEAFARYLADRDIDPTTGETMTQFNPEYPQYSKAIDEIVISYRGPATGELN